MSSTQKKLVTDSPLVIYKASAGSGKTFTLTLYYLWLLLSKGKSDGILTSERNNTYRHILAVTFTNKATGEMKNRIIKSLYNLAIGAEDGNSKIYTEELIGAGCVKDKQELQERSKDILFTLLHDYSNFNVSTIDAFFQKTMRAFVRDIGMQGGYNVELDSDTIAKEAIDRMYLSLSDIEDDSAIKKWLLEYDLYQLEEGNKWDSAEKEIRKLSSQLFRDEYKTQKARGGDAVVPTKQDIDDYAKMLTENNRKFKKEWKRLVKDGHNILKGIKEEDLKGKSNSCLNYFYKGRPDFKAPSNTLKNSSRNDWLQKTCSDPETIAAIENFDKGQYIEKVSKLFDDNYNEYLRCKVLRRNLFSFGILNDIDSHIREIVKERNIMLLSDTTDFLYEIIKDSETPYIYEKTGVNIHHYMIDEFQDTSRSQWQNFLPLLKEGISKGDANLIVGDVKQSIYRWRGSDWSLLNGLPTSDKYFIENGAVSQSMKMNWRSTPNVVDFNNIFFTNAVKNLAEKSEEIREKISTAYSDNEQQHNPKKDKGSGYVKVEFVDKDKEYQDVILEKLYKEIQLMLEKGCSADDMAILTNKNDEAATIAQYLMLNQKPEDIKFYVISNEALKLKNSSVVRAILAIMRYVDSPREPLNKLMFKYEVISASTSDERSAIEETMIKYAAETVLEQEEEIEKLATKSLYEMCCGIADIVDHNHSVEQMPYLQALKDVVLSYMGQHGSSLSGFLDWWEKNSKDLAISTPETKDAIRILTIHKSKGLEFSTVFVPFCDWSLDKGQKLVWRTLPAKDGKEWLLPLSLSKDMESTPFADIYKEENSLAIIDSLNMLYVAFTRAAENLIVYAPKPSAQQLGSQVRVSPFMYNTISRMMESNDVKGVFRNQEIYELGDICVPESDGEKERCVAEISEYEIAPFASKLRLKLKGESYFDEHSKLSMGKVKHEMMSEVITVEDIARVAKKYQRLGVIDSTGAQEFIDEVVSQIEGNAQISKWFSPDNKVLNESAILNCSSDGQLSYRPDRVIINGDKVTVVDYKFGKESAKNIKQIESYIALLKKMGYFNVEGYIWYVSLRKVV